MGLLRLDEYRVLNRAVLFLVLVNARAPAIAGWLYDNVSPKVPFIVTLIGAIAIGVLMLALLKEPKGIRSSDTVTSIRQGM